MTTPQPDRDMRIDWGLMGTASGHLQVLTYSNEVESVFLHAWARGFRACLFMRPSEARALAHMLTAAADSQALRAPGEPPC